MEHLSELSELELMVANAQDSNDPGSAQIEHPDLERWQVCPLRRPRGASESTEATSIVAGSQPSNGI